MPDTIAEALNMESREMKALDFHTEEDRSLFPEEKEAQTGRVVNLRPVQVAPTARDQFEFEKQKSENRREDYCQVRANLQSAIEETMLVLGDAASECSSNPSARQFEVFANLVKTYADINKDLLDIHGEEAKAAKSVQDNEGQPGQVNNVLFAGNSDDLVDLIRKNTGKGKR